MRDPSVQKCMKTLGMTSLTRIELKRAFRTKAMQVHPDKGGSVEAMQEVNGAFRCLLTVVKNNPEGASLESLESLESLDAVGLKRREIMRRFREEMAIAEKYYGPN